MRPISIVRFQQAYLASVVLWLVNVMLGWQEKSHMFEQHAAIAGNPQMYEAMQLFIAGATMLLLILWLLLVYFVAHRASVAAKWIVVTLFVMSALFLPLAVPGYPMNGPLVTLILVLAFALNAYAVWLLFRPDAKAWFARRDATR